MQRIQIITLSNIGAVALTTPVLQRLHHYCPDAVIDILTDARAQETLEHCPYRRAILLKQRRAGALTLTVFGRRRPLRYHPYGPPCAWIVAKDESLDSLSARGVVERLHTLLEASANARHN